MPWVAFGCDDTNMPSLAKLAGAWLSDKAGREGRGKGLSGGEKEIVAAYVHRKPSTLSPKP